MFIILNKMLLAKKLNGKNSLQDSIDKKSIQMSLKLDFQL